LVYLALEEKKGTGAEMAEAKSSYVLKDKNDPEEVQRSAFHSLLIIRDLADT
jgi:hypothetical protein